MIPDRAGDATGHEPAQHAPSETPSGASGALDAAETPESGHVGLQGALPLDVRTGDARVDAAVSRLHDLDGAPLADHPGVFTEVHRALQDALVDLDRNV
jgi:hypothetical protein